MKTVTEKSLARGKHRAIIQVALIGYIRSVPTTKAEAERATKIVEEAMRKDEIAILEGGEYTREQVAEASVRVALKYFSGLLKTGLWEFTPHVKCAPEFVNYMNAVKEAVK